MPQMSAWCRLPFCMEGTSGPTEFPHSSQSYPHTPSLLPAGEGSGWKAHSGYSTSTKKEHSSAPGWALARDGYAGTGKIKAQQTMSQLKPATTTISPWELHFKPPQRTFGDSCNFGFCVTHMSSWADGLHGSGSSCSWWLLALLEPEGPASSVGAWHRGLLPTFWRQSVGCLLASNPVAFTHCGLPATKLWLLIWEGCLFSASCIHIYI